MKGNTYTIIYSAVLALVCASLLTLASVSLKPYQEANRKAKEQRTILRALGVSVPDDARAEQLLELYNRNVGETTVAGRTAYVYNHPSEGKVTAFRFAGPGLWGPIEGLLALKADMRTIYRMAIYKQEETPGLGGNIENEEFQGLFRGKQIVGPQGKAALDITLPGQAHAVNQVNGISGATLTGDKLEQVINKLIADIAAVEATGA